MTLQLLDRPGGHAIAVRHRPATAGKPTFLFLPGYASDMMGSKALALDALAALGDDGEELTLTGPIAHLHEGDTVEVVTPGGEKSYEIIAIKYA